MQLHKNRPLIIILTAALSVVATLVNQHVIPTLDGSIALSVIGGMISGYGVAVVGSGPSIAANVPVSATTVATATPAGVQNVAIPTHTVPGNV